jgi:hypothetical protein
LSLAEVIAEIDGLSCISDRIYNVRTRACEKAVTENPEWTGNTWDLPEVQRYSELCGWLDVLLKKEGLR